MYLFGYRSLKKRTHKRDGMDDKKMEAIKTEILELCKAQESGISEAELAKVMSTTEPMSRMQAINLLTADGKIQICRRGSELVYKLLEADAGASGISSGTIEEKAVYNVIKNSGNKGIWNKDIRTQTKLPLTQLSKVLKSLETRKLIKAVKSVAASKRKVYMLYNVEPDKSVTGGAWYSETEFESEYVDILYDQCYRFIHKRLDSVEDMKDIEAKRKMSVLSSAEIKDYIDQLKISRVELSTQDIEMVLETIVYDGLIERVTFGPGECPPPVPTKSRPVEEATTSEEEDDIEDVVGRKYYRALNKLIMPAGLMRVPCGQCPSIQECRSNAVISPQKCLYFERWFSEGIL